MWGIRCGKLTLYLRVHGHSGKFGVDVSAGCCCSVTSEGLRWGHLVPPAKFQRTAAVHLLDLWQVWLRCYHHTRSLAVHEVLLLAQRDRDEQRWLKKLNVCLFTSWAKHALCYLKDFGAVFKGVRVADVIDQTDNVAGHIIIRQVVKVREHFMKLSGQKNMDYWKFKMLSEAKNKHLFLLFDWCCGTTSHCGHKSNCSISVFVLLWVLTDTGFHCGHQYRGERLCFVKHKQQVAT